jgi:hypothetical protein
MPKGVPASISHEEPLNETQERFGDISSIYPPKTAENKYLRTVKETFDNHNQLERALCDNVTLHNLIVTLRAEKLNITTANSTPLSTQDQSTNIFE